MCHNIKGFLLKPCQGSDSISNCDNDFKLINRIGKMFLWFSIAHDHLFVIVNTKLYFVSIFWGKQKFSK